MRSETVYQGFLIAFGVISTVFLGVFFLREVYPEYRIYQNAYVQLEDFRSTYTHQAAPQFKEGVKQIVLPRKNKGPEAVDRCITCHVALKFDHFSPTIIAKDLNGNILYDAKGIPLQVPNPNYVWGRLNAKIAELNDEKVNQQLTSQGNQAEVNKRLAEAKELSALKIAKVGEAEFDMTKVLAAHPLIGRETRPFEFHPVDDFGCTSCHNGNGSSIVTVRAHGPVYDGQYEAEIEGFKPQFLESDPKNDPLFSKVFNSKPGHELLFQTTPLYVGKLIQAKCVQCHQPTSNELDAASGNVEKIVNQKKKINSQVNKAYEADQQAVLDLLENRQAIQASGLKQRLKQLDEESQDYSKPLQNQNAAAAQLSYLKRIAGDQSKITEEQAEKNALEQINQDLTTLLGNSQTADQLQQWLSQHSEDKENALRAFVTQQRQKGQNQGILFEKAEAVDLEDALIQHIQDLQNPLSNVVANQKIVSAMTSDIDDLTQSYQNGRQLFLSQACYACHRIAGFSRGGVGPELTQEGMTYPWFVKESIVWPQADLKTSTMPNMHLDHAELEDLMTYLLAQRTDNQVVSEIAHKSAIKAWEEGKKLPWEKPLSPAQIQDVRESMVIFATQGCASCHRLKGFESNVGYTIEKEKPSFDDKYQKHLWFTNLFPEDLLGSQIVSTIDEHRDSISKNISPNIRDGAILEEIEKRYPGAIEALYANFKFADRAKNHHFSDLIKNAKTPEDAQKYQSEWNKWKETVHQVLMIYIQEYGLGRLIGPRPNWSGIYRSDEWLMEHFWNPSAHVPRSIMPAFPFDNTKFLALVHMLDVLGVRNRDSVREIWQNRGFNPELAFQTHCAQCHGEYELGNGPVSTWIYPIPKNLRNTTFLENLTKKQAIESIIHGVKGTPMPPWGEIGEGKVLEHPVPVLTHDEIVQLVEWIYQAVPSMPDENEVPKWQYTPEDVIKELQKADHKLSILDVFPTGKGLIASTKPVEDLSIDQGLSVEQLFDVIPNPANSAENYYYIKQKYYTEHNLKSGEAFFNINCAVCHGKEADGSGLRAGVMQDAKPRMLTNLDWIQSRDDMRLLRSIKYGIQGTAMTPWGDQTTSLQRLQLVMYIRSLSETQKIREKLQEAIYRAYEKPLKTLLGSLSIVDAKLSSLQAQSADLEKKREGIIDKIREGSLPPDALKQQFETEKSIKDQIEKLKNEQNQLNELMTLVKKEQDENRNAGLQLINGEESRGFINDYLTLINLKKDHFITSSTDDSFSLNKTDDKASANALKKVVEEIDKKIAILKSKADTFNQDTPDDKAALHDINMKIISLQKVKGAIITSTNEAIRLQQKQNAIYQALQPVKP